MPQALCVHCVLHSLSGMSLPFAMRLGCPTMSAQRAVRGGRHAAGEHVALGAWLLQLASLLLRMQADVCSCV